MVSNLSIVASIAVLVVLLFLKLRKIGHRDPDLPPGPKTTPVLGNALDFPTSFPHAK